MITDNIKLPPALSTFYSSRGKCKKCKFWSQTSLTHSDYGKCLNPTIIKAGRVGELLQGPELQVVRVANTTIVLTKDTFGCDFFEEKDG